MSRLGALSALALSIALWGGGCGRSSPSSTSTQSAKSADEHAPEQTTAATTSSASQASEAPELILCQEDALHSPQVIALGGGREGVSATTLASFSNTAETTSCSVSPDLTKIAEVSETSEGSKVAGYLSSTGGGFVNLSGHEHNDYSGVPHTDEEPLFNPVDGELWWTSEGDIWSAALNGAAPDDHGSGRVGAFTTTGEPRAYQWFFSPDGSVQAFAKELEEIHYSQGLGVAIGSSHDVTAACENRAAKQSSPEGTNATDFVAACPGVARVAFETICERFVGLISDSEFVCMDGASHSFNRVSFRVAGASVRVLHHSPLTPSTTMKIGWTAISPDGKSLWYVATAESSQAEPTEHTKLYIVPTGAPTSEPQPVSVSPETPPATASAKGWRWHGHWLDGAP